MMNCSWQTLVPVMAGRGRVMAGQHTCTHTQPKGGSRVACHGGHGPPRKSTEGRDEVSFPFPKNAGTFFPYEDSTLLSQLSSNDCVTFQHMNTPWFFTLFLNKAILARDWVLNTWIRPWLSHAAKQRHCRPSPAWGWAEGQGREGNRGWHEDRREREQNKISPSKESGEGLHRLSLGSEDLPQVSVSSPSPSVSQVRRHG